MSDPGRLLSDTELEAAEAVVRAAIRWTDTGPKAKVMSSFDLIMAELQRYRGGPWLAEGCSVQIEIRIGASIRTFDLQGPVANGHKVVITATPEG